MSPIEQPESSNIWLALMRAQAGPEPRPLPDDGLEAALDARADFAQIRFDPGASMRERLAVLTPADLYRLREAVLGALAERQAGATRRLAHPGEDAARARIEIAITRAECGQLGALDLWIGAVLERSQLGFYMTRSNEEAMYERLWDFHAEQSSLAHDLLDYREALVEARMAARAERRAEDAGFALGTATANAELKVLRRAADALEHAFLSRWRAQRGQPAEMSADQIAGVFRDALRAVDALLLVRRLTAAYGPRADGTLAAPPAPDETARPGTEALHAVLGRALVRETLFADYARVVSFLELAARAAQESEGGVLEFPLAARQAIHEASRLAHALNRIYERYAQVVKAALGGGLGMSPLHVDFDLRHPSAQAPDLPSAAGLHAQFEGIEALLQQADHLLGALEPLARATVKRLDATASLVARSPHAGSAYQSSALHRFSSLHASARSLVNSIAFGPPAAAAFAEHADTLPVAAIAEVAQSFSVVRASFETATDRIRDAERFLPLGPEASDTQNLARRFFVLSGPCGLALPPLD